MGVFKSKAAKEITPIFFYAAVCVYTWAMLMFFWDFPAFLLRFSAGEIVRFLSYQLMYALLESAVVTAAIFALLHIAPSHARAKKAAAGGLLVVSFAASAVLFKQIVPLIMWLVSRSVGAGTASALVIGVWAFLTLALPLFSIVSVKNKKIADAVSGFSENLSLLAQLYAFLGLTGTLVVFYVNLF